MTRNDIHYIGVDLGGTTIKTGIVAPDGKILKKLLKPSRADEGPEIVSDEIIRCIKEVVGSLSNVKIGGVGIATPGLVNDDGNIVRNPPNFALWDEYPLRDAVTTGLSVDLTVKIENDANAAALAEARFGAGKGYKDFLFLIWGTGVGGGIIINGEIYHGPYGGAGEIGHLSIAYDGPRCNCGNIGCIESFIGRRYLSERAVDRLNKNRESLVWKLVNGKADAINPKILTEAANKGDSIAREIMTEAGELMGVAISSFFNVMNFTYAVVGGGIAGAGDLVFPPMNERIRKSVMTPLKGKAVAVPASLGNDAGILGAAGLVREN